MSNRFCTKTVTVSSEYQVIIPQEICDSMQIKPGQKLQIFQHDQHISLMPVRNIGEMRGFLKGVKMCSEREDEDRL